MKPVKILFLSKGFEVPVGMYSFKVLRGWSVSVGDFSIELKNKESGKVNKPKVKNWRVQSDEFDERAKK